MNDLRFAMAKKRSPSPESLPAKGFAALLGDVKLRIQTSQTRALLSVNTELIRLYWDIGKIIIDRQRREGWGASVIPRLSSELHNELPELKGFSERNIGRMIRFYRSTLNHHEFCRNLRQNWLLLRSRASL